MKTFYASSGLSHGSSGFGNFLGGADVKSAANDVFAWDPEAVIVDGTDNWHASPERRPEQFDRLFGVNILAYFHSGISGISKSGIVITKSELAKIPADVLKNLNVIQHE
jgi:hypothetical protein